MSLGNTYEDKLLNHLMMKTAFTQLTHIWVALHSADSGETGANELGAVGAYARVETAPTDWNASSSGTVTNANEISFPTATDDWNSGSNIGYFSLWDHATDTGATHFIGGGSITTPKTVLAGDTAKFNASSLAVSID